MYWKFQKKALGYSKLVFGPQPMSSFHNWIYEDYAAMSSNYITSQDVNT